jgi:transcriptional regulator with XRE-family HTH domain
MLRLKVIRLNAQLTAFQLAQAARISSGRYSYLERGMLAPSREERERLAQILGVAPASLFRSLSIRTGNQPNERGPRGGRSA